MCLEEEGMEKMTEKKRMLDAFHYGYQINCSAQETRGRENCLARQKGMCTAFRRLDSCEIESLMDYYFERGMLFPPLKIGDLVYTQSGVELSVELIQINGFGYRFTGVCTKEGEEKTFSFCEDQLDKEFFRSREDASRAREMDRIRREEEIKKLAYEMREHCKKVKGRIDIKELAMSHGIKIIENSRLPVLDQGERVEAAFDSLRWNIVYDDTLPLSQVRLLIARALGHIFLNYDEPWSENSTSWVIDGEKAMGDDSSLFARCLLGTDTSSKKPPKKE